MTIVSDVSKDGSKLLVTNAPKGQPEIYLYSSGSLRAITDYNGIDVSGNFVDNDSRVVFVSDRLGYPNIFVTGIDGGNVQQMVYMVRTITLLARMEVILYMLVVMEVGLICI